jgi:thioredoxin reductase (NADPH)
MKINSELAIIGAGIAGVSAAIYAKRMGLEFLLFEPKTVGGQLLFIENIDNYAGAGLAAKGKDFASTLLGTLKDLEIDITSQEITGIQIDKTSVKLIAEGKNYNVKALIVASGAAFRSLGLSTENNYIGKGLSYCAVCDGFFFKNKDVAVIGGGNTAAQEALHLAGICRKVYLIHRREQLRAIDYLQKQLRKKNNVEIIFDSIVREIEGKDILENIVIENVKTNRTLTLPLNGLFIAIGVRPHTDIFKDIISMDDGGFILTNEEMKTSCDFVWACGDCRKRPLRQLITAASEGAIAAMSAFKYLKGGYISA